MKQGPGGARLECRCEYGHFYLVLTVLESAWSILETL